MKEMMLNRIFHFAPLVYWYIGNIHRKQPSREISSGIPFDNFLILLFLLVPSQTIKMSYVYCNDAKHWLKVLTHSFMYWRKFSWLVFLLTKYCFCWICWGFQPSTDCEYFCLIRFNSYSYICFDIHQIPSG